MCNGILIQAVTRCIILLYVYTCLHVRTYYWNINLFFCFDFVDIKHYWLLQERCNTPCVRNSNESRNRVVYTFPRVPICYHT